MLVRYPVLIGACFLALPSVAQDSAASLTGKVINLLGAPVAGTVVELGSERSPADRKLEVKADLGGIYRFSGLASDRYSLTVRGPGSKWLTVKAIDVAGGEAKSLPTLELAIGSVADCGGHPLLDHIRFIPSGGLTGTLIGSVTLEGQDKPVIGAVVTLTCAANAAA